MGRSDLVFARCALKRKFDEMEKIKVRGHRKVKCELNQALVMITLYVKFNVHSSNAKQAIVLKVAEVAEEHHDNRNLLKFGRGLKIAHLEFELLQ